MHTATVIYKSFILPSTELRPRYRLELWTYQYCLYGEVTETRDDALVCLK